MSWLFSEEWVDSWKQYYAPERKMNDQEIENEIVAKGLTAPRVTPERIADAIKEEYFFTGSSALKGLVGERSIPLSLITFCILVLRNGFTVTGESACASPENFDAELGRKVARQHAVNKIWALEGYLLKQHLYDTALVPTVNGT